MKHQTKLIESGFRLFLDLWCIVIEIGGAMRRWELSVICLRRCSFGSWYICNTLIFSVVDTLLATDVSAIPWYSLLQMLFFRPMYLRLAFLWTYRYFSARLSYTIASTSHIFDNVRMLLLKIAHPQLALSMLWGYFPSKFCIFNPPKFTIADIIA